jgi:hypothetical protein
MTARTESKKRTTMTGNQDEITVAEQTGQENFGILHPGQENWNRALQRGQDGKDMTPTTGQRRDKS